MHTIETTNKRGLSAAGWADDGGNFSGIDRKGNVMNNSYGAVVNIQPFHNPPWFLGLVCDA
jgi:hypothetical protein